MTQFIKSYLRSFLFILGLSFMGIGTFGGLDTSTQIYYLFIPLGIAIIIGVSYSWYKDIKVKI